MWQMAVYIMRYEWDISSCNQTLFFFRTSTSFSSMFFPSWGKPWFPDFPMNHSDSTRNESENGRIGWDWGIDPSIDGHPTWHKLWGKSWDIGCFFATWLLGMSSKWYPNMVPFITGKMRVKTRNHQFSGYCTVFWNKPKWGSKGIGCCFF